MIDKGEVDDVITKRRKECTGFPFEVFCQKVDDSNTKDVRQICYMCQNKTKWQCIKCRFYFCMHTKEIKNRPADFYEKEEKENTKCNRKKTTKIYGKSCFHAAHEEAIRKAMKEEE